VHTGFWWGNQRDGDHLKDPGVDGRIILKWILEKWEEEHELDRSGSEEGLVEGCCECSNEPSGSIKWVEFLE
jgi:hypothetical protein